MGILGQPTGSSDAVVLRTWPSGDTSVVASLLSADHGYVRIIAKGARAGASVLRPLVQPGRLVNAEYGMQPSRELQYLKGGQLMADALLDAGSLSRTAYVLAAMELADRCRPGGECDRAMFELCRRFLLVLSSTGPDQDASRFYHFEMRLLDLHGVAPEMGACVRCAMEAESGANALRFDPAEGGVVCSSCGGAGRRLSREARDYLIAVGETDFTEAPIPLGERSLVREVGVHLHGFLTYHVPAYRLPAALDLLRTPSSAVGRDEAAKERLR